MNPTTIEDITPGHKRMLDKGAAGIDRKFKYDRRGAREVISRMASPTGILVEGHLLRVFREQGFELDPEVDNKSVYSPDALFDALARYTPSKTNFNGGSLKKAIDLAFDMFGHREGMKKLRTLMFDYHLRASVKMSKSSGAPLFTSKEEAFEQDFARAERIANRTCTPPPCTAYHRVQHGEEGPKTRLVWGYPLSMTLLEARFARPLIERFLMMRSAMCFGLAKHQIGGRVLELSHNGVVYGLDFSKFDSSLPNRLVHAAFDILKSHFDFHEGDEEVWSIVKNYFIHTTILMPDGYVYQKHCGVPSGSYFTQLIDSVVNYIVVQYLCLETVGKAVNPRLVNVLGDDSLFTLSEWVDLEALATSAKDFGMSLNVLKSGRYRTNEVPSFLGHEWHAGIPDRPEKELVKRVVFPERPSKRNVGYAANRDREAERLMSFVGDAACAWGLAYNTGIFGMSPFLTAFQNLQLRSPYPATGMQEIEAIVFGKHETSAARIMLLGLLR